MTLLSSSGAFFGEGGGVVGIVLARAAATQNGGMAHALALKRCGRYQLPRNSKRRDEEKAMESVNSCGESGLTNSRVPRSKAVVASMEEETKSSGDSIASDRAPRSNGGWSPRGLYTSA